MKLSILLLIAGATLLLVSSNFATRHQDIPTKGEIFNGDINLNPALSNIV